LWSVKASKEVETILQWDVVSKGYRAGEFYNPVYAAYITGMVRIQLNQACQAIQDAGGTPILTMTDSIFWDGTPDMLPETMWRGKKTLGFFEKPEIATDFICLGSGRYGYTNKKGYVQTKRRGINVRDFKDVNGAIIEEFNWMELVKKASASDSRLVDLEVSVLISPGLIRASTELGLEHLGRVVKRPRQLELTVGHTKRIAPVEQMTAKTLATTMIYTKPIHLTPEMSGEIVDGTYPNLREQMEVMELVTAGEKKKEKTNNRVKAHYQRNGKERYRALIEAGLSPEQARSLRTASMERVRQALNEN